MTNIKSMVSPKYYLTLHKYFPDIFTMSNNIKPNEKEENETIRLLIVKTGLDGMEIKKYLEYAIKGKENELSPYIGGNSNAVDTNGISNVIIMFLGMFFVILFYTFF